MTLVVYSSSFAVPPAQLFAFHMDAANLARISPPIPPFRLVEAGSPPVKGDVQVFRIGFGRAAVTWRALVSRIVDGRLLEDVQLAGPFRRWRHQHRVTVDSDGGSLLTDVVAFRLIPTRAGEFLEFVLVRPAIIGMFAWRHRRTRAILAAVQDRPEENLEKRQNHYRPRWC